MGSLARIGSRPWVSKRAAARARGSPRARQAISDGCHWLPDHGHLHPPGVPRRARAGSRPGTAAGRPGLARPRSGGGRKFSGPVSGLPQVVTATANGPGTPPAVGHPAALAARNVSELAAANRRRKHAHQPPLRDPAPLPRRRAAPGGGASDRVAGGRGRHQPGPHPVAGPRPRPRPGHHQQPAATIPRRGCGQRPHVMDRPPRLHRPRLDPGQQATPQGDAGGGPFAGTRREDRSPGRCR